MRDAVRRVLDAAARWGRVEDLTVAFGTDAPDAPALIVTAGVHGTEPIGTAVAIAYLHTLIAQLGWDDLLHHALARCRIAVMPLVNPVGMARGTRCNGNGVDLMRNAPSPAAVGTPLVGGQRCSPRLPWFMGRALEPEAAALLAFVERHAFRSPLAIGLDIHSGFGLVDRLWYPYARTRAPLPDLPRVLALRRLLDATLPNHVYQVEPTAQVYTIRGDLWDHLYDARRARGGGTLLPLTLEIGSWTPRLQRRTLRRHLLLLDFLFRAARSHPAWT